MKRCPFDQPLESFSPVAFFMNRTLFASGLGVLTGLSMLTACSGKPLQPDVALEARQQHF